MSPQSSPLRRHALVIIGEVLGKKKFASQELDRVFKEERISARDRALLTQLVYGILRDKGFLDGCLKGRIDFHRTPPAIRNILRIGAYQILLLDKIPDHAAIFESVQLAKKKMGPVLGNLVNAVLRGVQRDREKILKRHDEVLSLLKKGRIPVEDSAEVASHLSLPTWLWERWSQRLGISSAVRKALDLNSAPGLFLRTNTQKLSQAELLGKLRERDISGEGIEGTPMILIHGPQGQALNDLFQKGLASIQDLNSFKVLAPLQAIPGERGFDVCAGHGGKASALVESLGESLELWVYDKSPSKINELYANFKRLGLRKPKVLLDKSPPDMEWDWLLVDAPCSGLGTLNRKPEIKWRLELGDLKKFAQEQKGILARWAPRVKAGGRILYAVCSLEPEEGAEVLQSFLQDHPDWKLSRSGQLQAEAGGGNGFFWGRLDKKS